jgi:hypothetical protein
VLQFPQPYRLVPGQTGVTVPLSLPGSAGSSWRVVLRLQLTTAYDADTCVHDSQLSYRVLRGDITIAIGTFPQGQATLSTGLIVVTGSDHGLRLVVTARVPEVTDAGCEYSLDPSGSTATH